MSAPFPPPDMEDPGTGIAVVGMAGRFPGAPDVDAFWENLKHGVESIRSFSLEELRQAGVSEAALADPAYVRAIGLLDGIDLFDAGLFGFSPREAALMDPQHRLFLETAWEALETAGCNPDTFPGLIGVFAGSDTETYLRDNLLRNPQAAALGGQLKIWNEKDFVATRTSYRLNLRGPSLSVQTACSTSLVAVAMACQSLLDYHCDLALAGGVSITAFGPRGYVHHKGGILSPDGHCRSYDAGALGAVPGNGVGAVVLKRLAEAVADGDNVLAVILGSSVNNDGAGKAGFTAPSLTGQTDVVRMALAVAGVPPETVGYVEGHGSGTPLGDAIELTSLARVFGGGGERPEPCVVGSVKSNVGHLDAAAGIAGFIKAVLAVQHGQIPPTLHFTSPNPQAELGAAPLLVSAGLRDWRPEGAPRRAGVSSLGIGGTNAHVVLEEPPPRAAASPSRPWQLLVLSARTETSLEGATDALARHLRAHPELALADAAYTCQVGRRLLEQRRVLVCRSGDDAAAALEARDPRRLLTTLSAAGQAPAQAGVAFLFPGLGEHYVGMGRGLYDGEPVFRREIDRCAELLRPRLGVDLRDVLYAVQPAAGASAGLDLRALLGRGDGPVDAGPLRETRLAQPLLFVVEHALARLWSAWGVRPQALLGYSLGEYVAATEAGVLSLEDALVLVAERARLIQELPAGAMLAVPLPESEARSLLGEELSLAAVNGPATCVLAGPVDAVADLERRLAADGVACRRVPTSHAFHSRMMEPIVPALQRLAATIRLHPPQVPYVSNVTGTWITPAEAADPGYWARHLCETVRLSDGLAHLLELPRTVLLEAGPGQSLTSLALQLPASPEGEGRARAAVPSLRHAFDRREDQPFLLQALGHLWMEGVAIYWQGFHGGERRLRVPLPTYAFDRQRYWVDPAPAEEARAGAAPAAATKRPDPADWFYLPSWLRLAPPLAGDGGEPQAWLVLADALGVGAQLAARLTALGHRATLVYPGEERRRLGDLEHAIRPRHREDYEALLADLGASGLAPARILHLWSLGPGEPHAAQDLGYFSLVALAQALDRAPGGKRAVRIDVIADGLAEVQDGEVLQPEKAPLLGVARVLSQENPDCYCRSIDVLPGEARAQIDLLLTEVLSPSPKPLVACRGAHRWAQTFEPVRLDGRVAERAPLRQGGVYLLVGGLGHIGLTLAEHLVREHGARLALTGRSASSPSSRRAARIERLRQAGAEVLLLAADAADEAAMREVVATVEARYGRLDGVFYLAGVVEREAFCSLREMDEQRAGVHFRAKAAGLHALERALGERALDFCLLFSSLSSVLGGLEFGAYAAANGFMDAFTQAHNQRSRSRWTVVDWDTWGERDGEAASGAVPAAAVMTREEGIAALLRVLGAADLGRIVVSLSDLGARLSTWVEPSPAAAAERPAAEGVTRHPRPQLGTPFVAPGNAVETAIAGIWQELFDVVEIGVHDDFFQLGGHSLLGIRVMSRLREGLGVDLPVRQLFETPTIADLALVVEAARQEAAPETAVAALPEPEPAADGEDLFPLSLAQQRLWLLHRMAPESPAYNFPVAYRLRGPLDRAALAWSLRRIVERHEPLRSTFPQRGGQPMQAVAPTPGAVLPEIDLTALPAARREPEALALCQREQRRPFDLAQGPVLRACLLTLGAEEHVLLLVFHHIVFDGWSLQIFLRELATLYAAPGAVLPALPVRYGAFARWQRSWLQGEELERQLHFWERRLAGAPQVLALPTNRPRPPMQSHRGAVASRPLPAALLDGLRELSRREGVTLFMTLLAAFQTLLYRLSGEEDVVVGTDVANRNRVETEGLIGFFVNLVALRTGFGGGPTFREVIGRVREAALAAYAHQEVPFEMVVERLRPQRSLAHNSLVQVLFLLQDAWQSVPPLAGRVAMVPLSLATGTVKFDLVASIAETEEGPVSLWSYSVDLFDADTIRRMQRRFETLLATVVEEPRTRIDDLILETETERRQRTMEKTARQTQRLKLTKRSERRAVDLAPQDLLVEVEPLSPAATLPLLVRPKEPDLDLAEWAAANRDFIEEKLLAHGALLFRGFPLKTEKAFERFAAALCPDLYGEYGDLPKNAAGHRIYEATPYPPAETILFHNEASHTGLWPLKQMFFCLQPARQGGETPIVDCRQIFAALPAELAERFSRLGLLYTRNFVPGLDVSLEEFFGTGDPAGIEEFCRAHGMGCEWRPNGVLRITQAAPAVARHPKTGETVFFNQIQLHHGSLLPAGVRDSMLATLGEDGLPRSVYYGDGSPIGDEVVAAIVRLYWEKSVSFLWQQDDLLLVDNMLVSHARNPFVGPRRNVVAMGEMIAQDQLLSPLSPLSPSEPVEASRL